MINLFFQKVKLTFKESHFLKINCLMKLQSIVDKDCSKLGKA